jgi:predicted permease
MNPFLLLLPDIALIAIGFALSRKADWGQDLWPGIEKLTYYVARMGGDGPFVALCITTSTRLAVVTLPLWLAMA